LAGDNQPGMGIVVERRAFEVDVVRLAALTLLGSFALFYVSIIVWGGGPPGGDFDRVWSGAIRLRTGEALYINSGDPLHFYTWAPWLAWLYLPLTYLPKAPVAVGWFGLCLASWAVSLWPARRSPGILLLIGSLTFFAVWSANVQPMMTAALVLGVPRRWGPLAVGAAASLKVSPILFVVPWVMARKWKQAAVTIGIALLLGAPALFNGIDHYPFNLAPELSLRVVSPLLFAAVAAAAILVALELATTRFMWLAAAVAVIAARPSLLLYDVGYLLVGLRDNPSRTTEPALQLEIEGVAPGDTP
jgi:hypothetical protein